jgi:virginiamycin B lyase
MITLRPPCDRDKITPVRGGIRTAAAALTSLVATLALAASASAAPVVDGEFAIPDGVGSNNEITQGSDGSMWVTRENANGVARITSDGTVTAFPTANTAFGITTGPDNNLWVTTAIGVAKIDPATGAELDTYNVGFAVNGAGITSGPDNNLWAVAGDKLVRFSPADPEGTATDTTIAGMQGKGMDTGTDGLLWIADASGNVHSATAENTPTVTTYATGGGPQDVAAGPASQVAYANPGTNPQTVGRITPGGTPQLTELEPTDPFGATFGQDGAYWIARANANDLLRVTPDGQTTMLTGFSAPPPALPLGPRKVATGPNNTLWVTLEGAEKVARVTGVEPPGNGNDRPETTIDKKPKKKLKLKGQKRKAKAKFKFSSPDAGATFECKLTRKKANKPAKFKACQSPRTYKLKPGRYKFEVRAVAGGVADDTPAKRKFKVVAK